jgi:hypothetical protein
MGLWVPLLALLSKLDLAIVRQILDREEFKARDGQSQVRPGQRFGLVLNAIRSRGAASPQGMSARCAVGYILPLHQRTLWVFRGSVQAKITS